MSKEWFHKRHNLDVGRLSIVVAASFVFWIGVSEIIPEGIHHSVEILLGALNSALVFAMRSGKPRDPGSRNRMTDSQAARLEEEQRGR